ncbi:MAG: cobyric acid synthase [Acidimicrobiales bacterium]|nr:cobyric acid synthase [Acidimicrobiales bacterium]
MDEDSPSHDQTIPYGLTGGLAGGPAGGLAGGRGALMVCGTTSDAGKTVFVAGLCRLLARNGVRVAPFKAQNMALNSAVTAAGDEIGRAQYLQAQAAGIEPEVAHNPILLKPTGERAAQVVVNGRPRGTMTAAEYHEHKPQLRALVLDSLADLRRRFDVVVLEGAGSPTEINLLAHDLVNLPLADAAGVPAIVVGDIDRGGVFAALHGTVDLLPAELRRRVRGFVINKFRGDPALLGDGTAQLQQACGVPTLGVIPMLSGLGLDAEDSLFLERGGWEPLDPAGPDAAEPVSAGPDAAVLDVAVLDVAVLAFPHASNVTDLDPLAAEAGVAVRLVHDGARLGRPDLVVLPGSKHTVGDLAWLRRQGFEGPLRALLAEGRTMLLGLCGGYQMLGHTIVDEVESGAGTVAGLGLLPVSTEFGADKVLVRASGRALGEALHGYQIHHGRVRSIDGASGPDTGTAEVWLNFAGAPHGVRDGMVWGTSVHGLFEADGFRRAFLTVVTEGRGVLLPPSSLRFAERRQAALDRVADAIEAHCDLAALAAIIASAGPGPTESPPTRRGPSPIESPSIRRDPSPIESPSIRRDPSPTESPPIRCEPSAVESPAIPPAGPHGGDGAALARALGLPPGAVLDLSASLNPFAPDAAAIIADRLRHDPLALRAYPDPSAATAALATALDVDPDRLVLTNGGAEAIALVAGLEPIGWVEDPEFSLYRRHLARIEPGAPRWRSNPSNPLGRLAPARAQAAVWDEAFFPLATGRWSRGDHGGWRLGSLTKLWACPGLRLGYAIAPDAAAAARLASRQPRWAVGGPALACLNDLLAATDLVAWHQQIAALRATLVAELQSLGLVVSDTDVNWVLVHRPGLRDALAPHAVAVRDCTSFGLPGTARIALPRPGELDRLLTAVQACPPVREGGGR